MEDPEIVLLRDVKQANDRGVTYRFIEHPTRGETFETWHRLMLDGLVEPDEDDGWRITEAGRERLG